MAEVKVEVDAATGVRRAVSSVRLRLRVAATGDRLAANGDREGNSDLML